MQTSAASPPTARREAFGFGLAFLGALGLGGAIAIARIAYDAGATGLTIAFPRAWLLVALLLAFCRLTRRRLWLPRPIWLHCLGAGAILGYLFYGNIAAAQFIEAPVAALLFFIYPPLTTLFAALLDRKAPSPTSLAATAVAFAGLALMLGVGFDALDWRGVALGLTAGTLCAVNMIWVARALPPHDAVVTMTHMAIAAAVTLTVAAALAGGAPLPTGAAGWSATVGAAVLQAMSIPLIYVSLPIIGAERSAVFNNLQPVATIVVAYILLGETLGPMQLVGAGMIVGGIFLMQAATRRGRPG